MSRNSSFANTLLTLILILNFLPLSLLPANAADYTPDPDLASASDALVEAMGDEIPPGEEPPPITLEQSGVSISILASPARIRGGEDLIYTVSYANNSGSALSNVRIKVTWTFWFGSRPSTLNADKYQQYCAATGANACAPINVTGPAVTRSGSPEYNSTTNVGSYTYTIGDLANGVSGSFQIALRVPENVYPLIGKEPRRPSASAELFVGSESTARVVANSSALVEGPLFRLEKERTVSGLNPRIFPTQTGEFRLRLSNVDREDSITATNVKLTDVVPLGAEFVSSVRGPDRTPFLPAQTVVNGRVVLTWTIDQLARGQTIDIFVTFRKLDIEPCDRMENKKADYYVTSDEIPFQPGSATNRYQIPPQTSSVSYSVRPPVEVVFGSTQPVVFGERGSFTFKVRNYWPQALNGLRVNIVLQPNVRYVPGSASAVGTFTAQGPTETTGGTLSWQFNMPAGTISTPVEQSFAFEVTGRYTTEGNETTVGSVVVPAGVPQFCNVADIGGFNVVPRLAVAKYSEAERSGTNYIARNNQPFQYVISLINNSSQSINDIKVYDLLPAGNQADFSYVANSATIDSGNPDEATPFEPMISSTPSGSLERTTLIWEGIDLAPGESRYIRYNVITRGQLLNRAYCNDLDQQRMVNALINPDPSLNGEEIEFVSARACVRISPNIQISKVFSDAGGANLGTTRIITGPVPPGGQTLYFTLTITNAETANTYTAGLVDFAPQELAFQAVEFSNLPIDKRQPEISGTNPWTWPTLAIPPGQTYTVRIRTLFNPPCITDEYTNRIGYTFIDPTTGQSSRVSPRPPIEAVIDYRCGTNRLDYDIQVDRANLSLRDRGLFTLRVRNLNANAPLSNVIAYAFLPPRYLYSQTVSNHGFDGQRSLPDGYTELRWRIPSIPAGGQVDVLFRAFSADVIGSSRVYARATADNLLSATCAALNRCALYSVDEQSHQMAFVVVTTRPLHTYTPRIEGINECAVAGDERLYTLTLLNTNLIPYTNTTVTLTLPIGLSYVRSDNGFPAPQSINYLTTGTQAGSTQVVWRNLTVPAKPSSADVSQLTLQILLRVGQVWSDQGTSVEVTSPDGIIPRTDGEVDPTVRICVTGPAVAKTASITTLPPFMPGDPNPTFLYQIEAVNPTNSSYTITLRDVLPAGLTYNAMLRGSAPQISTSSGRTVLTWNNLTVPAQSGSTPGRVSLLFRVTANPAQINGDLTNTVNIVNSSVEITDQLLDAPVSFSRPQLWIPIVVR
ncbi:isopeptide-forming domain-containing fimbrial protein [Chloroflexus sp.]|uniref:isopeptide-forming domain-containing fimbrial protein n=1 Tax=Chloroflexus sp. TaxID=1904827 RepID=UPI0026048DAB|nr:isopeptide-forming domain-containing fimbrial protein [uncultured Chloroflexus sp.]